MGTFTADIPRVVDGLLVAKLPLGGEEVEIFNVMRFNAAQQTSAQRLAHRLLRRDSLDDVRDARVLFAAAHLAYKQDPHAHYRRCTDAACIQHDCQHPKVVTCSDRVPERVRRHINPGMRATERMRELAAGVTNSSRSSTGCFLAMGGRAQNGLLASERTHGSKQPISPRF